MAQYGDSVVNYEPGTGFSPGYDNPDSALGEPSRVTEGTYGGPVNPFSPAWKSEQLVSVGADGSISISFDSPIQDVAENPFGIDFILFGNNGFTIINGDFTGGGITDGSTFTFDPPGASAVFVSQDNIDYYELVPPSGAAATVDGLFPTDGAGDFSLPVDPSLSGSDFQDAGLAEIAGLYGGSAGGTGFDLSWAQTAGGEAADLASVNFVRLDVYSGKVELDAIAVVPEPATSALLGVGFLMVAGRWGVRKFVQKREN